MSWVYRINPEKAVYNFIKMSEKDLGYYGVLVKPNGEAIIVQMSISYEGMDNI
ncbi:MAG: hypothetical protein WBK20_01595 [Spirochaetota bacterium]